MYFFFLIFYIYGYSVLTKKDKLDHLSPDLLFVLLYNVSLLLIMICVDILYIIHNSSDYVDFRTQMCHCVSGVFIIKSYMSVVLSMSSAE